MRRICWGNVVNEHLWGAWTQKGCKSSWDSRSSISIMELRVIMQSAGSLWWKSETHFEGLDIVLGASTPRCTENGHSDINVRKCVLYSEVDTQTKFVNRLIGWWSREAWKNVWRMDRRLSRKDFTSWEKLRRDNDELWAARMSAN
jgi:hypothetical protein